MSIFNEFLPKLNEISRDYINNFNDDLKAVLQCLDKFEEDFLNEKNRARDKGPKDKNLTTLQSINEDEDEATKTQENEKPKRRSSAKSTKSADEAKSSLDSNGERRGSKKRNKNEVEGIVSPEQDKRQKRNASVKAQSIIAKQVNVNLTQKLRREDSVDKTRRHRAKDDDKENSQPLPIMMPVRVKLEKLSLPPEPMDTEPLPDKIEVKQEDNKDDITMPPPVVPVAKPRKAVQKEKSEESTDEESGSGRRRATRTKKQTDTMPPPQVPTSRMTRASSRITRQTDVEDAVPEARPKRTRAKKKAESESSNADAEKESQAPQENGVASPAGKPRPKRTRRGQRAAEKEESQKPLETPKPAEPEITLNVETLSAQEETIQSPVLKPLTKINKKPNNNKTKDEVDGHSKINLNDDTTRAIEIQESYTSTVKNLALEETRIIAKDSMLVNGDMNKTVVLPNGVYDHAPVTPLIVRNMNETVVLDKNDRETMVQDKPKTAIMDATVVIERDPKIMERLTDDNSLLTNDSDTHESCTPPKPPPVTQPLSAVKEKVQQFEQMASRLTRTKTRAMAKKQDDETENHTPPDKISKPVLSVETLNKMNSMIFNGKPTTQISSSAGKPRANVTMQAKPPVPSSASKVSGVRAREAEEQRRDTDARSKKEAMLEAKREMQRRKREEKMAAAAAAREQAEKERQAAMEAAARGRMEKQAHADQGKLERMREAERRKLELARKVAETEERRRAEELARQQRLADEQRRAELARKKQLQEAEAMKKEAAIIEKEMEKRQKEYIKKQKLKMRLEGDKMGTVTPLKTPGTPRGLPLPPMEPVHMADGFQYLDTDEEDTPDKQVPVPAWSTSKSRRQILYVQSRIAVHHIERLFSVREHSPDLCEIFPGIERSQLKRTSSAVWRTPPSRLPVLRE